MPAEGTVPIAAGAPRYIGGVAPQSVPEIDAASVVDAHNTSLAAYLNQPVQDVLARLGVAPWQGGGPAPAAGVPAGQPSPVDPLQLIQPVTDALGTLGSGQFDQSDPTQTLQGITQTLESAGQSMQQALSDLAGQWQGAAASAAWSSTRNALTDGAAVSRQSAGLADSLSTAAATVQQAQARLIQIIDQFTATIAAIGPNIIFPWGIAAAIAAANEAVTEATEVMTDTQGTLGSQASRVAADGAPVPVSAVPQLGLQGMDQVGQMASTMAAPAMQGIGAVMSAVGGATAGTANLGDHHDPDRVPDAVGDAAPMVGGGGFGGGGGGPVVAPPPARLVTPMTASPEVRAVEPRITTVGSTGVGGGPMMGGGAGMGGGQGMRAGLGSAHQAAAYLHTTDQGDEIVGDLGSAAPPVIGAVTGV